VLESAGKIVKSVEKVSSLVEHAVSSPLLKVIGFAAGVSKAASRFRGGKGGEKR
jgi:hypothetical protein